MAASNTKKKEEKKFGKCYDCNSAYLMQSHKHNPIIALCQITKERWVASMDPHCGRFSKRVGEAEIHPMIHLCK